MTTGKNTALTRQTFVGEVISLLFNMLSRLVIAFLPRSKCLLISWMQSSVILEPKKIKCVTVSIVSPSICHEVMGFPGGASGTEPTCQSRREVRDAGSILVLGRSSGAGHGNPLQYFCLENPMNRGAWHVVAKSQTQLRDFQFHVHFNGTGCYDLCFLNVEF